MPVEPQKNDYLVTVSPNYEGEYEDARYRWDHVQWEADFTADPDVRVPHPDDLDGPPIYEGPASDAHAWIIPGVYEATRPDGRGEFRLVVGEVPVGREERASAAFPPPEHDSTVVNEIARILKQHTDEPGRDPAAGFDPRTQA